MTQNHHGWLQLVLCWGALNCGLLLAPTNATPVKAQAVASSPASASGLQALGPQELANVVVDEQRSVDERSDAWTALLEKVKGADLVPFLKQIVTQAKDLYASAALGNLIRIDQASALEVLAQARASWPFELQTQALQDVRSLSQVEPRNEPLRSALRLFLRMPPEEASDAPSFKEQDEAAKGAPWQELQKALVGSPTRGGSSASAAEALAPNATAEERSLILQALDRAPREARLWIAAGVARCDFGTPRLDLARQLMADEKQPLKLRLAAASLLSTHDSGAWRFASATLNNVLAREGNTDIIKLFHEYWTGSGQSAGTSAGQARDKLFLTRQTVPQLFEPLLLLEKGAARRLTLKMWASRTISLRSMALAIFAQRFPEEVLRMRPQSDPLLDAYSFNTHLIFIALHHPALRSQVEKKMGSKLFAAALRRVRKNGITLG